MRGCAVHVTDQCACILCMHLCIHITRSCTRKKLCDCITANRIARVISNDNNVLEKFRSHGISPSVSSSLPSNPCNAVLSSSFRSSYTTLLSTGVYVWAHAGEITRTHKQYNDGKSASKWRHKLNGILVIKWVSEWTTIGYSVTSDNPVEIMKFFDPRWLCLFLFSRW